MKLLYPLIFHSKNRLNPSFSFLAAILLARFSSYTPTVSHCPLGIKAFGLDHPDIAGSTPSQTNTQTHTHSDTHGY